MNLNEKTKHFLFRAGFGPTPDDSIKGNEIEKVISLSVGFKPIDIVTRIDVDEHPVVQRANGQKQKELFQKARKQVLELNANWVSQLSESDIRIREKMTLFWHDHFACRIRLPYLAQQQNNVLRENALGGFGGLLSAISKDPGMLQFLNNQQNKKNSPNENFARELLELFTLGHGHYSEHDIKNSARAFTGWGFNPVSGKFIYREKVHDSGPKEFKGKRGNFNGDDVLSIILEEKQTARFITSKLLEYFVTTESIDEEILSSLASAFYDCGYKIDQLLKSVYSSNWFYDAKFVSNRIKSPVELIAGILTQTGGKFDNIQAPLFIQRALSQILFYPPNVGGWPTGTAWIDSSSLTFRMSLPNILLKDATPSIEAKDDGDMNNVTNHMDMKKLSLAVDWTKLSQHFTKANETESLQHIEHHLLAGYTTEANRKLVSKFVGKAPTEPEFIKRAFVAYMSLPEYQLS